MYIYRLFIYYLYTYYIYYIMILYVYMLCCIPFFRRIFQDSVIHSKY